MSSRFEFIKEVKDAEFHSKLGDLYEKCLKIEHFMEEAPADCLMNIRKQNERLVKHVCRRLVGREKAEGSTYEILRDSEFTAAVNDATLIAYSDRLRFDGNQVTYSNEEAPTVMDEEMSAELGVTIFAFVVNRFCKIIDALSPGPDGRETAGAAVQDKSLRTAEQPPDANCQAVPRPSSTQLPLAKSAVYPLSPPNNMPRLFDPINGLVHYFIRPNDEFALNSLELLGADACLYRLLKQEGFERIAFLEIEHEDIQVNTYDAFSKDILSVARLRQQFSRELCRALEHNSYKTAIVMPLSVLEKNSGCRNEVVSAINRIDKAGNGGNILLLTATHRSGIVRCFTESIGLHPWLSAALLGKEDSEKIPAAIHELEERGMIVLADEYRADEIANLLLRKKLVDGSGPLKDLPVSKVYELAGLLLEHCLQDKKHFDQIPYQNRGNSCIRQLNALLDDTRVQQELVTAAGQLKPSGVGYSNRLGPLFLERICHIDISRYKKNAPAASAKAVPLKRQKKLPRSLFKNLPQPYQPGKREPEELIPLAEPAVLFIEVSYLERAKPCHGTGFLIHPDGYALTSNHVIENANRVEARLRTVVSNDYVDIWYPCEIVYGESACDMAVLKLCEPGSGTSGPQAGAFPYLPMASESRVIIYNEAYIMPGFPEGKETASDMTILNGKIASLKPDRQRDQMNLVRCNLDGKAFEGNSGSPIISIQDSRVIGLLTGAIRDTQGLDFMRPIKYFWWDFLR